MAMYKSVIQWLPGRGRCSPQRLVYAGTIVYQTWFMKASATQPAVQLDNGAHSAAPTTQPEQPTQPVISSSVPKQDKSDKKTHGPGAPSETKDRGRITIGSVQQGPCGVLQIGGSSNQATGGNCQPPEPKITWHQEASTNNIASEVVIVLEVDRIMDIPTFLAECDRPCKTTGATAEGGGYHQSDYWSFANPQTIVGVVINGPRPLGSGIKVGWPIQSRDDNPIKIIKVLRTPDNILQQMLRNKK